MLHLLVALLATSAHAFTFTPMSVSFDPSGTGSTRSFQIENDSDASTAVEISMSGREIALDGEEKQPKSPEIEGKFLVYPPQMVLKPKEKRTVRVTWKGDAKPQKELAYRIIAEQLPVDTEKKKANEAAVIKMLLKYMGAVYITPAEAKPELRFSAAPAQGAPLAKPAKNKKPAQLLALEIENLGGAHEVLAPSKVTLSAGGKSVTLAPEELEKVRGQNILAGAKRRIILSWPAGLPVGPVQVSLEK